ncbi:NTTRR-F1 domain [Bacillus carboniphilus]|uniref:NTTRR-F1 domain n=1 Tax=Bacillus carboniphilus TaxID=86663 RepID=A0ABY9JV23_9BACI|nr:NTTRR-F1 domain [Bacillus carboniphilus]WLR43240.1 NTTRR-F1 domain [Bacillus carboniphilus]
MAQIQNLISNGSFRLGQLGPWQGENSDVIMTPCPVLVGNYTARLAGGEDEAFILQTVNVIEGESYQLSLSLATVKDGNAPPMEILVIFLDRSLREISIGLEATISEGQLPNGKEGNFNLITLLTETVPLGVRFAEVIIRKGGLAFSPSVVVDNVFLTRFDTAVVTLPNVYVGESKGTEVAFLSIDDSTNIIVGEKPIAILSATTEESTFLYVGSEDSTLSIIDSSTNNVINTISLPSAPQSLLNQNIIARSDHSKVYITTGASTGYVSVIDTATNTLETSIRVGSNPSALAITSESGTNAGLLFVLNTGDNTISEIDTSTNIIINTIETELINSKFLVSSPDNQYLVVASENITVGGNGAFVVFEISNLNIIAQRTLNGMQSFKSLVYSLDGSYLYGGVEFVDELGVGETNAQLVIYNTQGFTLSDTLTLQSFQTIEFPELDVPVIKELQEETDESLIFASVTIPETGLGFLSQVSRNDQEFRVITGTSEIDGFGKGFFDISSSGEYIVASRNATNQVSYIQVSSLQVVNNISVANEPLVLLVE